MVRPRRFIQRNRGEQAHARSRLAQSNLSKIAGRKQLA
ncbi:hypothetical protein BV133_2136 [Blastochloris viridis]|uniref:Uncharacterized protein n=1 Tax=Blastochloris viridis TaxID=1079 RepID=A0A182D2Q6_BLAVI|nr:hypothetical protein BV133_2136 [Blastochloris viridis]